MKVLFGLLADAANQTADGRLNILGAFSEINAPAYPTVRPMVNIVIRLEISASELSKEYEIEVVQLEQDGATVAKLGAKFRPALLPGKEPSLDGTADLIFPVQVFIPKPGPYHYSIMMQGEEKARIPFRATVVPQGS